MLARLYEECRGFPLASAGPAPCTPLAPDEVQAALTPRSARPIFFARTPSPFLEKDPRHAALSL